MKELIIDWTNIPVAYRNFYISERDDNKYVLIQNSLKNKYNAIIENRKFVTVIVFNDSSDYVRFMLEWG